MLPLGGGTSRTKVLAGIKVRPGAAVYRYMTRSFRSAVCAVSMFALAAGAANAQTLPATSTSTTPGATTATTTTTTTTTPPTASDTFTLPQACEPSAPAASTTTTTTATATAEDADQSLDEGLSACVAALRTELASDDQHGLGEWVSQAAHDRHDNAGDDGAPTATTSGTTATTPPTTTNVASTTGAPALADQPPVHGRGHGHQHDN